MGIDSRDLLAVLKLELEFLETGGYRCLLRTPSRGRLIFKGSPSCMNYDRKNDAGLCSDCVLIQLVPAEHRAEKIPCLHIPLNAKGETIDSLYRSGTQAELEDALDAWLRAMIQRLQQEREKDGLAKETPHATVAFNEKPQTA